MHVLTKAKHRMVKKSRENIREGENLKYNIFRLWSWLLGTKKILNVVFLCYVDKDETFLCDPYVWSKQVLVLNVSDTERHKILLLWLFPLYFNSNLPTVRVVLKINRSRKWMYVENKCWIHTLIPKQFKINPRQMLPFILHE